MRQETVKDYWYHTYTRYTVELSDLLEDGGINPKWNDQRHKWKGWEYYLWDAIKKITRSHKNKEQLINYRVNKVSKAFIDILIDELIEDNAIYVLPDGIGYIAIAQRPIKSVKYNYVIKYRQAMPTCYFLLTDKGYRSRKKNYKIILSDKNEARMMQRVKDGYIYMTFEQLIREVGITLKPKRSKDASQHKVFRPYVYPKPVSEVMESKTVQ